MSDQRRQTVEEMIEDFNNSQKDALDAERYRKLRRWMSSNVKEGWQQVENLGALGCYMDWETFDQYLDELPVCNVGLCHVGLPIDSDMLERIENNPNFSREGALHYFKDIKVE